MSVIDLTSLESKKEIYACLIQAYDNFLMNSPSEIEALESMLASAQFEKQILKAGEDLEKYLKDVVLIKENKLQLEKTKDQAFIIQKTKIQDYTIYSTHTQSIRGSFDNTIYILPVNNLGPIKKINFNELTIWLECRNSDFYGKDKTFKIDTPPSKAYSISERGVTTDVAEFHGYKKNIVRIFS